MRALFETRRAKTPGPKKLLLQLRETQSMSSIPEEDVQLVATQANVSPDQARAALEQTKGDLAQAILLLSQTK